MSSIIIPGSFDNEDLPVDLDLKAELIAHANLTYWAQADASTVTLASGLIVDWLNLKGGAKKFSQGTAGIRAALSADATLGYDVGVFSSADGDYYDFSEAPDLTGAFSFVCLAKAATLGATKALMSQYVGASQQTSLFLSSSNIISLGHRGTNLTNGTYSVADVWKLFIASGDATHSRLKVDDGSIVSGAVSGSAASGNFALGSIGNHSSKWNGSIADAQLWNIDLLDGTHADLLADVVQYFRGTYGLDM